MSRNVIHECYDHSSDFACVVEITLQHNTQVWNIWGLEATLRLWNAFQCCQVFLSLLLCCFNVFLWWWQLISWRLISTGSKAAAWTDFMLLFRGWCRWSPCAIFPLKKWLLWLCPAYSIHDIKDIPPAHRAVRSARPTHTHTHTCSSLWLDWWKWGLRPQTCHYERCCS